MFLLKNRFFQVIFIAFDQPKLILDQFEPTFE